MPDDLGEVGKPFDQNEVSAALKALLEFNQPDATTLQALRDNSRALGKFLAEIHAAKSHLESLEQHVDATLTPKYVFNLNDPGTIGEVIVFKLEAEPTIPLEAVKPFYGSGIYALYYHGEFPAYQAISGTPCPIYVGKAGPQTPNASSPKTQGTSLFNRIKEHRVKSIEKATNLTVADFSCRHLVVQSSLEKAAEEFLIRRYSPVWNDESKVCSGLGKHGDKARAEKSDWDVLHPGRPWASGQSSRSGATANSVTNGIIKFFQQLLNTAPEKWTTLFNHKWVSVNVIK
jgi:hypothetical protein